MMLWDVRRIERYRAMVVGRYLLNNVGGGFSETM